MKPDGVTMDTTEPIEAAEFSMSQDNAIERAVSPPEQAENEVSPEDATKTNGGPDPQVELQAFNPENEAAAKTHASSRSGSQPRTAASHQLVNITQSSANNTNSAEKTAAKPPVAGPAPKRPVNVATVAPTAKTPTRVTQRRPAGNGPSRTTSSATATNGSKPATLNGSRNKRTAADNVSAAKVKSSVTVSRSAASTAPKPSTFAAARVDSGAVPKNKRPPIVPLASRVASSASRAGSTLVTRAPASAAPASSASRSAPSTSRAGGNVAPRPTNNVASRPTSSASSRTAASRVTTVPSTGRSTATQPHPAAATKKDVSRPPSTAVAKRPAASSFAVKKPEPTKPPVTGKPTSAFKLAAMPVKADPKVSQPKTQQHANPGPAKYSSMTSPKLPAASKKPLRRTPPASPANISRNGSTAMAKHETKPTQAVVPFSAVVKKTKKSQCNPSLRTQRNAGAALTNATPAVELAKLMAAVPKEASTATSVPEVVPPQATAVPPASQSPLAVCSPPRSPVPPASPAIPPPQEQSENDAPSAQQQPVSTTVALQTPKVASLPEIPSQSINVSSDQTTFISKAASTALKSVIQVAPPSNLNDEEDEEEREGSQLVSVSEMSGTTQPTEESRPGSAGPLGGSAWRAGGAFLSELDSLSGSQQGASELSASRCPGRH
ncbi:mucin-19-like [Phycodurus eques]|uniref:mucin-19-like n=1 Tax=Phycodurus eques TaxID=693459 RepID=UPI002ACED2A4|nr:mucin-19-like [Phycodurus eques]